MCTQSEIGILQLAWLNSLKSYLTLKMKITDMAAVRCPPRTLEGWGRRGDRGSWAERHGGTGRLRHEPGLPAGAGLVQWESGPVSAGPGPRDVEEPEHSQRPHEVPARMENLSPSFSTASAGLWIFSVKQVSSCWPLSCPLAVYSGHVRHKWPLGWGARGARDHRMGL